MKAFISQPMRDMSDMQIISQRINAIKSIKQKFGQDTEIIDSYFEDGAFEKSPLWWLGRSLQLMSSADIVYFCKGWEDARGCRIEHSCAQHYDIPVIIEQCDPSDLDSEMEF